MISPETMFKIGRSLTLILALFGTTLLGLRLQFGTTIDIVAMLAGFIVVNLVCYYVVSKAQARYHGVSE